MALWPHGYEGDSRTETSSGSEEVPENRRQIPLPVLEPMDAVESPTNHIDLDGMERFASSVGVVPHSGRLLVADLEMNPEAFDALAGNGFLDLPIPDPERAGLRGDVAKDSRIMKPDVKRLQAPERQP